MPITGKEKKKSVDVFFTPAEKHIDVLLYPEEDGVFGGDFFIFSCIQNSFWKWSLNLCIRVIDYLDVPSHRLN